MLPQYERLDSNRILFRIRFGIYCLAICMLPFLSFAFCVGYSLWSYFERATATHCGVRNYLPSISAAIGNYQPQRFVWQLAILLQVIPRLTVIYQYYQLYQVIVRKNRRPIAYTACIFNVVENLALVGLSLWTSIDDYEIHKTCFITFIATSECYMCMTYFLNKNGLRSTGKLSRTQETSLTLKRNLFVINVVSFFCAGYCFVRHNDRCEPGVYTLFALFEYIVVLTNMGFHLTSVYDFRDKWLIVDASKGLYFTSTYSTSI